MPFNKFEPHREVAPEPEATNPQAARRVLILRWAWRLTLLYTAVGFGFIAYWLVKGS